MTVYKTLPNNIRILEFDPSMAQAVADMWNQSGEGWGGYSDMRSDADVLTEVNGGAYLNVFVAEHEGEIWGYASLSKYFADDDALYLHVLNVRPDKHGQKLGKYLVLQCVERTIELGFPRLDIHTWPGNTKAVPLYKKCGYMWEDRTDSTHLVNFVPTVLQAEPCKAFFEKADWYADNNRPMEIKPDGVKVNEFEIFKYSWEKDGQILIAGFERTGRKLRLLETNDYRIEMMAESHELAFGLMYTCTIEVENKTGIPLHIRINGKRDANIYLGAQIDVPNLTESTTFTLDFHVGEITEPQDIWQVHPCVLAEVEINGQKTELGLGIETRWPVSVELEELKRIAIPGTQYEAYLNLTSALRTEAAVVMRFPQNPAITHFDLPVKNVSIPALGKTSLQALATAVDYGHEAVAVEYEVTLADGRMIQYTRRLDVTTSGLSAAYGFESETDYIIQNGVWRLGLNKNGAWGWTNHVYDLHGGPEFCIGQLSLPNQPYSDEFTRMKPIRTALFKIDEDMILKAVYASKAVPGTEYTTYYRLNAQGIFTRWHKVTNVSDQPITCGLKDECNPSLWTHTVLPYDGGIQTIRDGLQSAAHAVDIDLIDENWAFEDNSVCPCGIGWHPSYKLNIRWGSAFFFEHTINLPPGESFTTEPVIIVHKLIPNHNAFRDFMLQTYTEKPVHPTPHLTWEINGGNPFSKAATWTAQMHLKRNAKLEGECTITAGDSCFTENENRHFSAPATPADGGISIITTDMQLNNFRKKEKRAIFTPLKDKKITTNETGSMLTASNGLLTFKVDPGFSDVCFSCEKDNQEWLTSRYPSKEPFSWYNPFIGGLYGELKDMWHAMTLREKITASFTTQTDTLGNVWEGLSSTVTVSEFEKYKGISYTQYYLTMPGLPVLCYFARVNNDSGLFKRLEMDWGIFVGKESAIKTITISGIDPDGIEYSFPAGHDSWWRNLHHLAVAEINTQKDKLYVYRDGSMDDKQLSLNINSDIATIGANWQMNIRNGETDTSKPVFLIWTPQELTDEWLVDLNRVVFPSN